MTTYRVAVASLVHDHIWGEIARWKALPNIEMVAAGDINPDLRVRFAQAFPDSRVYDSWQAMLDAEGDHLDIVQVTSENSAHADIVEAAAAKKLHVIVEKPMAATYAQAKRMVEATSAAGVRLMVNWPTAWSPAWQEMERRILEGQIGQVRYFKYRSAHNGPREIGCDPHFVAWLYDAEKNGAGAFMDYCGYGAAMAARLLGRPQKVTALRGVLAKEYPLPDDAAILTMQFAHAQAVTEASWIQPSSWLGPNPIALGSEGTIGVEGRTVRLQRVGGEVQTIEPPATVAPRRSGPEYFVHCIETGEKFEGIVAPGVSLLAQEILQAGLDASDSGATQTLS